MHPEPSDVIQQLRQHVEEAGGDVEIRIEEYSDTSPHHIYIRNLSKTDVQDILRTVYDDEPPELRDFKSEFYIRQPSDQ